jgi:hypothetical protein
MMMTVLQIHPLLLNQRRMYHSVPFLGVRENLKQRQEEKGVHTTRIPSLRGELGLLASLWLDVSSFWEEDCKEVTFAGAIDWDA